MSFSMVFCHICMWFLFAHFFSLAMEAFGMVLERVFGSGYVALGQFPTSIACSYLFYVGYCRLYAAISSEAGQEPDHLLYSPKSQCAELAECRRLASLIHEDVQKRLAHALESEEQWRHVLAEAMRRPSRSPIILASRKRPSAISRRSSGDSGAYASEVWKAGPARGAFLLSGISTPPTAPVQSVTPEDHGAQTSEVATPGEKTPSAVVDCPVRHARAGREPHAADENVEVSVESTPSSTLEEPVRAAIVQSEVQSMGSNPTAASVDPPVQAATPSEVEAAPPQQPAAQPEASEPLVGSVDVTASTVSPHDQQPSQDVATATRPPEIVEPKAPSALLFPRAAEQVARPPASHSVDAGEGSSRPAQGPNAVEAQVGPLGGVLGLARGETGISQPEQPDVEMSGVEDVSELQSLASQNEVMAPWLKSLAEKEEAVWAARLAFYKNELDRLTGSAASSSQQAAPTAPDVSTVFDTPAVPRFSVPELVKAASLADQQPLPPLQAMHTFPGVLHNSSPPPPQRARHEGPSSADSVEVQFHPNLHLRRDNEGRQEAPPGRKPTMPKRDPIEQAKRREHLKAIRAEEAATKARMRQIEADMSSSSSEEYQSPDDGEEDESYASASNQATKPKHGRQARGRKKKAVPVNERAFRMPKSRLPKRSEPATSAQSA